MDKKNKNNQIVHKTVLRNMVKWAPLPLAMAVTLLSGCGGSSSSSGSSSLISGNTLIINEVMAKDSAGGNDWIELYVTEGTVNLADYSLVDDDEEHERQSLPDLTLTAGEFSIINAVDEDDADSQDDYYVTFKLGTSDSVNLYYQDSLVDSISWNKGEALAGFSYGRYTDGTGGKKTLTPTQATSNIQASRGPLIINEIVNKDANDGDDWFELYNAGTESIELINYTVVDDADDSIETALPDVSLAAGEFIVVYATDVDPGEYYVPFKLGSSDSLSLKLNDETVDYLEWDETDAPQGYSYGAFPDGAWASRTLEVSKGANNVDAVVFESDVIENIYITIADADWQNIIDNALDKEYHSASVTYKDVTVEDVAFRTKGNSTLSNVASYSASQAGYTRFSFKVDTNEYVSGQKLLNMKKLNFNNNLNDPSYMRETISYDVMRNLGVPAPRTSFVKLYINDELHGLYTMVEAVNGDFLEQHFENSDGDLYKPDNSDGGLVGNDLVWIDAAFASYTAIEKKSNEDITENTALMTFLNGINNSNDASSLMDSDTMLRYLAASTAMSNLDSYQGSLAHNYYLYEEGGQFSIIPWDFNESFGTFSRGCDVTTLYIDEPTEGALSERPLIESLLSDATNLNTYHDYLSQLINGGDLDPESIESKIDDIENLISTAVSEDPTAFYTHSAFESGLTSLLSFATQRADNIQDQLDGTLASSGDGNGCGTTTGGNMPPGRPGF